MATYLYGLLLARNANRVGAGIRGIAGSDVRALTCGSLAAIVSTVEKPAPTLAHVQAHDAALQRVVDAGVTAAAVRFGQSFSNDDDACTHVRDRGDRVAQLLEEYDGSVEVRLLVAQRPPSRDEAPADPQASPGTAYLRRLHGRTARVNELAVRDALGPVVLAERVEELPRSRGVVFVHLVRREALAAYREAVAGVPALADAQLVGPLPLYSFADTAT